MVLGSILGAVWTDFFSRQISTFFWNFFKIFSKFFDKSWKKISKTRYQKQRPKTKRLIYSDTSAICVLKKGGVHFFTFFAPVFESFEKKIEKKMKKIEKKCTFWITFFMRFGSAVCSPAALLKVSKIHQNSEKPGKFIRNSKSQKKCTQKPQNQSKISAHHLASLEIFFQNPRTPFESSGRELWRKRQNKLSDVP